MRTYTSFKLVQKAWVRKLQIHKLQIRKSQKHWVRKSQIRKVAEGPQIEQIIKVQTLEDFPFAKLTCLLTYFAILRRGGPQTGSQLPQILFARN